MDAFTLYMSQNTAASSSEEKSSGIDQLNTPRLESLAWSPSPEPLCDLSLLGSRRNVAV